MKRIPFTITILTILGVLVFPVKAQDDWQTYTSEDRQLSFQYPNGWTAEPNEEGGIDVMSEESLLVIPDEPEPLLPGQFKASITFYDPTLNPDEIVIPFDGPPLYTLGFTSGIMALVFSLGEGFSGEEIELSWGTPEEIEINGIDAAIVRMDTKDDGLIMVWPLGEGRGIWIQFNCAKGEMDSWQDTIYKIAESIELKE